MGWSVATSVTYFVKSSSTDLSLFVWKPLGLSLLLRFEPEVNCCKFYSKVLILAMAPRSDYWLKLFPKDWRLLFLGFLPEVNSSSSKGCCGEFFIPRGVGSSILHDERLFCSCGSAPVTNLFCSLAPCMRNGSSISEIMSSILKSSLGLLASNTGKSESISTLSFLVMRGVWRPPFGYFWAR